jgi:hypothetical protein
MSEFKSQETIIDKSEVHMNFKYLKTEAKEEKVNRKQRKLQECIQKFPD